MPSVGQHDVVERGPPVEQLEPGATRARAGRPAARQPRSPAGRTAARCRRWPLPAPARSRTPRRHSDPPARGATPTPGSHRVRGQPAVRAGPCCASARAGGRRRAATRARRAARCRVRGPRCPPSCAPVAASSPHCRRRAAPGGSSPAPGRSGEVRSHEPEGRARRHLHLHGLDRPAVQRLAAGRDARRLPGHRTRRTTVMSASPVVCTSRVTGLVACRPGCSPAGWPRAPRRRPPVARAPQLTVRSLIWARLVAPQPEDADRGTGQQQEPAVAGQPQQHEHQDGQQHGVPQQPGSPCRHGGPLTRLAACSTACSSPDRHADARHDLADHGSRARRGAAP